MQRIAISSLTRKRFCFHSQTLHYSSGGSRSKGSFGKLRLLTYVTLLTAGSGSVLYYISNEPNSRKYVSSSVPYGREVLEAFDQSYAAVDRAINQTRKSTTGAVDGVGDWSKEILDAAKKALDDTQSAWKKLDAKYQVSERANLAYASLVDLVSGVSGASDADKTKASPTKSKQMPTVPPETTYPKAKTAPEVVKPVDSVNSEEAVYVALPIGRPKGALSVEITLATKRIEDHLKSLGPVLSVPVQNALNELRRVQEYLRYIPQEQAELFEKGFAEKLSSLQDMFNDLLSAREYQLQQTFTQELVDVVSSYELKSAEALRDQAVRLKEEAANSLRDQYLHLRQKWHEELESKLDSERRGRLARLGELAEKLDKIEGLVGGMAVGLEYQAALLRAQNAVKVLEDMLARHNASTYLEKPLSGADVNLQLPFALLQRMAGHLRGSCKEAWSEFLSDAKRRADAGVSSIGNLQASLRELLPILHGTAYMPYFEPNAIQSYVDEPVAFANALSHDRNPVYQIKVPPQSGPVMVSFLLSRYVLAPLSFVFDIPWFQSWPQRLQPGTLQWAEVSRLAERAPEYRRQKDTEWPPLDWSWSSVQYVLERLMHPIGAVFHDAGSTTAILKRAEFFMFEQRDLDAAAREVNQLHGWPQVLAHDWLNEARKRLELDQALKVVKAHLSLLSLEAN